MAVPTRKPQRTGLYALGCIVACAWMLVLAWMMIRY